MKRFLIFCAKIISVLLLLLLVFDLLFTSVYRHGIARNKIQYILQMQPRQYDRVFLGSSRTANHIVSGEVRAITQQSAINLGMEGATLEDNLLELKLLLAKKVAIKKLYLQVDYLYEKKGVSTIANSAALPFLRDAAVREQLEPQLADFDALYYVPFYRYLAADYAIGFREFFFTVIRKKPQVDLSDGFSAKQGSIGLKPLELPAAVSASNSTIEEFRSLCRRYDIELVLFCAPFCSETIHLDYVAKLKERLPDLRDYSTAMPDSAFYNCGHLNAQGAIGFTRLLVSGERP